MLYDTYDVKNGETPESIAFKLYDDAELHWVILLLIILQIDFMIGH